MNDVFKFKCLSVSQRLSAMKVGTDGVLLGAWARGGDHILDIGCGTGVIALMMAQRYPHCIVQGVDIDADAAAEAGENVKASPFAERVSIFHTPLQSFMPTKKFDAIVSNPPFFNHGFTTPDKARRMARQTTSLSFADITDFAAKWLATEGELSVVLPVEELSEFSFQASLRGLFLAREYSVKTVANKAPKRCLVSYTLSRPKTFDKQIVVLMDGQGERTAWYHALTQDFYIS